MPSICEQGGERNALCRGDQPKSGHTLGSLRFRHADTKQIVLIPTPSNDPNDPLNWSNPKRYYVTFLVCLSMFLGTFLASGPSVAILEMTQTFFGPPGPQLLQQISKVAYFITGLTFAQGIGNLFWMPLILKYGRRPVYIFSFAIYTITAVWASVADSYANELASRIVMGSASGVGECLAPLTIADVFFLHERGTIMALYTASLCGGVAGGIIVLGLITIDHGWRTIYYVATALIGTTTLLLFLTMPETSFVRPSEPFSTPQYPSDSKLDPDIDLKHVESAGARELGIPKKHTFIQNLRIFHGYGTTEPLLKLFIRPLGLLILPPVLWATLVMSVTVGFLVAISSNFATAFSTIYGFKPYQAGLCFVAAIVGSLIGIAFGGLLTDKVADFFTRRNGGIREPEMRLPAIAISFITAPLLLILYGVGIQNKLHWMVPTLALGLLNFSIVQAVNVSFVYTIDSYRPIGGEIMVTQLAFKACFSFLLSFYTNPWIASAGYTRDFCTMAAINGAVLLVAIPMYFFSKRIRHASLEWKAVKFVHWKEDREVGE